jgi:hypothetical protein
MNLMRKGQVRGRGKGERRGQVACIASLLEEPPKLNRKWGFTRIIIREFLQDSPRMTANVLLSARRLIRRDESTTTWAPAGESDLAVRIQGTAVMAR